MKDKFLTVADLKNFFNVNQISKFDYKEQNGRPIVIHSIQDFSTSIEPRIENGKLYTKVRVCHTGLNRNGSYISEENMKKAMGTLKDSPLLGYIHKIDETGEYDFWSHNTHYEEDEDGNEILVHDENQIGSFTSREPYLEYDKEMDKTYLVAEAAIPEDYSMASEIIKTKQGTKVSCELAILSCSYNSKEDYLSLDDFVFMGVTCLGKDSNGNEIHEGMQGSKLTLEDFELDSTQEITSGFDIKNSMKGGNKVFETLLEKYGKTVEDITFDYEGLSDEELEAAFMEAFDEDETEDDGEESEEPESEGEPEPEDDSDTPEPEEETETPIPDDDDEDEIEVAKINHSITYGEKSVEFSVSMNKKLESLTTLVNDTYSEDMTWYSCEVYDDDKTVIMIDCWSGKAYRQAYKVKDDVFSLKGDRVEVFSTWMTLDEQKAFDNMKANYSEISTKLEKFESEPQKMEIINSEDYSQISMTEDYQKFAEQASHFDLTLDEVKEKCDEMLLDFAKKGNLKFASTTTTAKSIPVISEKKKGRYGNLFAK